MNKMCVNPPNLFNSVQYGFSQIVVSNPGKHVFISGQVAWDEKMNIIGENDLKTQIQKSIENLQTAMKSVGGTLDNVVMLRIYKVDYKAEDGPIISEALRENFGIKLPASSWINVKGLANEGFMIEVEAQAII